ncbi:hypothetical protein EI74_0558 [Mycoplasma testudineum]|uniref:Uncharacterized protein n=1 Tax=Mycoplasma testudineum TaxID=244584 RepID=A0A4R6IE86_9MOLU|nr:hypothetical protein [Mycoplasma testudineum]OYD26782.1 hypothetical protein CG473_02400 [Mycoplasma testudineum]TDO19918.1 hypothetical protein EI74_0558 [Mycoplasma testudineum]
MKYFDNGNDKSFISKIERTELVESIKDIWKKIEAQNWFQDFKNKALEHITSENFDKQKLILFGDFCARLEEEQIIADGRSNELEYITDFYINSSNKLRSTVSLLNNAVGKKIMFNNYFDNYSFVSVDYQENDNDSLIETYEYFALPTKNKNWIANGDDWLVKSNFKKGLYFSNLINYYTSRAKKVVLTSWDWLTQNHLAKNDETKINITDLINYDVVIIDNMDLQNTPGFIIDILVVPLIENAVSEKFELKGYLLDGYKTFATTLVKKSSLNKPYLQKLLIQLFKTIKNE